MQFTRSDEIESVNKTIIHDIWHCIYYYYVLAIGHDKEFFGCALYYYIYILLEEGFNLSAHFVLLLRTIYVNDHTVWSMNHIHCNWWKYPIPFHLQDIWMKYILWILVCLPLVHFWWDLSKDYCIVVKFFLLPSQSLCCSLCPNYLNQHMFDSIAVSFHPLISLCTHNPTWTANPNKECIFVVLIHRGWLLGRVLSISLGARPASGCDGAHKY